MVKPRAIPHLVSRMVERQDRDSWTPGQGTVSRPPTTPSVPPVTPTDRPKLVTLADVDPTGLADGDVFIYEATSGLFKPGANDRSGDLVVAASDSPQFLKDRADYVCDGVGDQVEIQAALDASSGTVWLAGGTYAIAVGASYGIRVWGRALRGLAAPWSQIAALQWASGAGKPLIELNAGTISDLYLYTEGTVDGVFPKGTGSRIERCYIETAGAHGVAGSWVTTALTVVDSQFNVPAGFRWINLTASPTGLTVAGCWDDGGGGGGINIAAALVSSRIERNWMFTGDFGIVVTGGNHSYIVANQLLSVSGGPGIKVTGTRMVVTHNMIDQPAQHGINVFDGVDCLVADNVVRRASWSVTNTYDGILVDGANSNRVAVLRNLIRGDAGAVKPRYGVNVAAGNNAIAVENDVRPAAEFGTGPLNNAGTGTILNHADHATYGDNWT